MGSTDHRRMDNGVEMATLSPSSAAFDQRLQLPASCDPPGPQNPPQQRVWIIFGATGHMGRSLVKAALAHGDLVTAVGRTFQDTIISMQDLQPSMLSPEQRPTSPESRSPYLPLLCDVRIRSTVEAVFTASIAHWGRMDVIANASGYGVIGACEDQDDFEIRNQFETNFWGTVHILQLSLPYFRTSSSQEEGGGAGRYLIFSSTGGSLGVPGLGPFCATKYAVEGLIESMLYETAVYNIRATLVEPGHVRRDDPPPPPTSTTSQHQHVKGKAANALPTFGHFFIKPASKPYDHPTAPAGHAKRMLQWLGDRQPTSAVKAAELVWQLGHCRFPPLRLLLGGFAVESVRDRLRGVTEEIEDWKFLSFKSEDAGVMKEAEDEEGEEDEEDEEDGDEEGEEGEDDHENENEYENDHDEEPERKRRKEDVVDDNEDCDGDSDAEMDEVENVEGHREQQQKHQNAKRAIKQEHIDAKG